MVEIEEEAIEKVTEKCKEEGEEIEKHHEEEEIEKKHQEVKSQFFEGRAPLSRA